MVNLVKMAMSFFLKKLTLLTILTVHFSISVCFLSGGLLAVAIVRPKSGGRSRFNERRALSLCDLLAERDR